MSGAGAFHRAPEGGTPRARTRPPAPAGLMRERLTALRSRLVDQRVVLVVAPAGSGKTTFLAQLTADAVGPVAWYWAESADSEPEAFVRCLEQSLAAALRPARAGWRTADDVGLALEEWSGPSPLLVVDDFHALQGSPAEATLEQVLVRAPDLRVLIATRTVPELNLSRLRVSGTLLEVGLDDLRFRSWEVDQLFREFYGEPLPPADVALLLRHTEGWAAALQLFHLATRDKHPAERRRTLNALGSSSRLVREYLARNVLDELPLRLRDFMLETSVLGRLTGELCDDLLDERGSRHVLRELERRQLFTSVAGTDDEYRYHDFLRSHLEALLVEEVGRNDAKARYLRAGELLEKAGATSDALAAYCRAEEWDAVSALLGREGAQLADASPGWTELIPAHVARSDPWLLLADARWSVSQGMLAAAVDRYRQAERGFGASPGRQLARRERAAVSAWLDPAAIPASDWSGLLRRAAAREPLAVRQLAVRELPPPHGALVAGLAALAAGRVGDATRCFQDVTADPDATPTVHTAAAVAAGVARSLAGAKGAARALASAADDAERLNLTWLARLSRAALVLRGTAESARDAESARETCERNGDVWGAALIAVMQAWGALAEGGEATPGLLRATAELERLRADALAAWASSALALALAREDDPKARRAAATAEFRARALGVPGAQALALAALAKSHPTRGAEYARLSETLLEDLELVLPGSVDRAAPEAGSQRRGAHSVEIRCFGGFSLVVHGIEVDLTKVKPRPRQLLHLLAAHAGAPVHREVLSEALWPNADPRAATRNLQVAVSSLRRALEPNGNRGGTSLIAREAEAYRLALPADAYLDLLEFDRALQSGKAARARGDTDASLASLRRALDLHRGELLPEDGPAEWLLDERERRSAEACHAACAIAELLLERGDAAGAATACEQGLRIDRFRDDLWRLCIGARERTGDLAAAARARREYEAVLAGFGLVAP